MKTNLRKIVIILLSLLAIVLLLFFTSVLHQYFLFEKFGKSFNEERKELGLTQISDSWKIEKYTWLNFTQEQSLSRSLSDFLKIITFQNIQASVNYRVQNSEENSIINSKATIFKTNILFWENEIESEIDWYVHDIDTNTHESLTITYYFNDNNGNKNYYESDYYLVNDDEFRCGSTSREEQNIQNKSRTPYFGNITKEQADSILTAWHKK